MKTETTQGPWGIFDTQDKLWIGNEDGPFRYDDNMLGRAAATLCNERFRRLARYRCLPLSPEPFRERDEVTPPLSMAQAWDRINKKKDWEV